MVEGGRTLWIWMVEEVNVEIIGMKCTWQNWRQKEKTRADAEEMVSFWSGWLKFTHKTRFHYVSYYLAVTELS